MFGNDAWQFKGAIEQVLRTIHDTGNMGGVRKDGALLMIIPRVH